MKSCLQTGRSGHHTKNLLYRQQTTMNDPRLSLPWQTKPTDRFVLKWIKIHLSARITPRLLKMSWVEPWLLTLLSSCIGVLSGLIFACGFGFAGGCVAALSQVLDGVDGQFARLTGKESKGGAFLDSVMDRYADGAMVMGVAVYLVRLSLPVPLWFLLALGSAALIGSNLISYSSARAENLGIELGPPTLASKGTRISVIILCGLGSLVWPSMPILALGYLALHPNLVIAGRLVRAAKASGNRN